MVLASAEAASAYAYEAKVGKLFQNLPVSVGQPNLVYSFFKGFSKKIWKSYFSPLRKELHFRIFTVFSLT